MFTLPKLTYDLDALEPYIDARTMGIHHGKHHAGYVANLNQAVEALGPQFPGRSLQWILKFLPELPETQRTALRNNGGGHYNHSLFWSVLGPKQGGTPVGDLAAAIDSTFGSFQQFKETFETAAKTRFGSGWAWAYVDGKELKVGSSPNQDNPIIEGKGVPILGLDVWEHAYYLKYQNRRPEYVSAFWNLVNWSEVQKRYVDAMR